MTFALFDMAYSSGFSCSGLVWLAVHRDVHIFPSELQMLPGLFAHEAHPGLALVPLYGEPAQPHHPGDDGQLERIVFRLALCFVHIHLCQPYPA